MIINRGGISRACADRSAAHVKGIKQGNSRGNYERMRGHQSDSTSSAARSTGIQIKAREPIDPSMPNLSPG